MGSGPSAAREGEMGLRAKIKEEDEISFFIFSRSNC
jgi:hypothetical protein